jgi:hypothetical protein
LIESLQMATLRQSHDEFPLSQYYEQDIKFVSPIEIIWQKCIVFHELLASHAVLERTIKCAW